MLYLTNHLLTEVLALDGLEVEGDEEIIAGLAELLNGDGRWTANNPILIVVQNGPKHIGRDALRHLVLAPLVRVRKLDARAKHPAEHRVGPCREQDGIYNESSTIYYERDPVRDDFPVGTDGRREVGMVEELLRVLEVEGMNGDGGMGGGGRRSRKGCPCRQRSATRCGRATAAGGT